MKRTRDAIERQHCARESLAHETRVCRFRGSTRSTNTAEQMRDSLRQSPALQPWRQSVQYLPFTKKSSLAFHVPLWHVLQFSNRLQPCRANERDNDKLRFRRREKERQNGEAVDTVRAVRLWRLTWVNNAGVALVQGVAAAGHGVAHVGAVGGAPALDQVVLTARTTHRVPARTRTGVPCQGDETQAEVSRLRWKLLSGLAMNRLI